MSYQNSGSHPRDKAFRVLEDVLRKNALFFQAACSLWQLLSSAIEVTKQS